MTGNWFRDLAGALLNGDHTGPAALARAPRPWDCLPPVLFRSAMGLSYVRPVPRSAAGAAAVLQPLLLPCWADLLSGGGKPVGTPVGATQKRNGNINDPDYKVPIYGVLAGGDEI